MSNNFDPFSSSPSGNYYGDDKKSKSNSFITVILVIAIIGFAIYYGSSYFFVSKVDLTFNIENTEGESISSKIYISKNYDMTDIILSLDNGISEKIKPGTYYYNIQTPGYSSEKKEIVISKKESKTQPIVLEKAINLKIHSITFPEKVYVGQNAILQIEYENTSENKSYSLSDLVIEGDIENWEYTTMNILQEEVSEELIVLTPKTRDTIFLKYNIINTSKKNNDVKVRVKYKTESKSTKFEIIEEPNINITGSLNKEIKSGESNNFTITINNSKNKISISDLTIDINVSGNGDNQDIEEWFNYSLGNIFIEPSKNKTESITVSIPQFAREDVIEGKVIFNSSAFKDPKEIDVKITVKEPTIDFSTNLSKSNITLNYDENNDFTNNEYIDLTLNNKSTIDIDLVEISVTDIDPIRKDCNNYIFIPENVPANMKVTRNTAPKVSLTITAKDTSLIGSLLNNTRICNINVVYKHPFRELETETKSNSIIININ